MNKKSCVRICLWVLLCIVMGCGTVTTANHHAPATQVYTQATRLELAYAPAPVDNPLKGLVPYAGGDEEMFPCSMEFNYVPLAAIVKGEQQYDWRAMEEFLNLAEGHGRQAVFRIFLEFPGRSNCIPDYLVKGGLTVHRYLYTNIQVGSPAPIETPDYNDPNLRRCLRDFVAALGRKYDGDGRIGFITAGLLGTWGEWHDHPHAEYFPGKEVQAEVFDAYAAAFHTTPILVRYPAGDTDKVYTSNARRSFGYHDDSFAWSTLPTTRPADSWFFLTRMKAAGAEACDKWKHFPIGGEIRPEAWGKVFDENPDDKQIQDFARCVEETHVTWLMDSGMYNRRTWSEARRKRGEQLVRRMGYEFHVPAVTLAQHGRTINAQVELTNRGVAPFYYNWPVQFALLGADGKIVKQFTGKGTLAGLLPGDAARVWKEEFDFVDLNAGSYTLALRVPNPLPKGKGVRFANQTQDQDTPGWLTLAPVLLE